MIKDQCNNCRKNGTENCTQDIVYDNTSCEQYIKKIDLSKSTQAQENSTIQGETNAGETNSSSYTTESENKSFLASLFSFKGRSRRTRYWLINIFTSLLFVPANLEGDYMSDGVATFTLLIAIPAIWIMLANAVKRFHDMGRSGWYYLFSIIPIINIGVGIYLGFFKGEECDNKYGPNPY